MRSNDTSRRNETKLSYKILQTFDAALTEEEAKQGNIIKTFDSLCSNTNRLFYSFFSVLLSANTWTSTIFSIQQYVAKQEEERQYRRFPKHTFMHIYTNVVLWMISLSSDNRDLLSWFGLHIYREQTFTRKAHTLSICQWSHGYYSRKGECNSMAVKKTVLSILVYVSLCLYMVKSRSIVYVCMCFRL